jgi:myosin heavy subunit
LSTLTKSFIILLTISTLFLCGYVVQYVSSVSNYKAEFEKNQRELTARQSEIDNLNENLKDERNKRIQLEDSKNNQIAALDKKIKELQTEIDNLKLQNAGLSNTVDSWKITDQQLINLSDNIKDMYKTAFAELNKTKAELASERTKLDETSNTLIDKEALIDMLEKDVKQLTEEKTALENKLNDVLRPYGTKAAAQKSLTPQSTLAELATADTTKIGLKGLVTSVDMKNSMAQISIGSSDGVKKAMRFHVSRGSEYICDIVITDVASEVAVGMLELVQRQPRTGDSVSTNW